MQVMVMILVIFLSGGQAVARVAVGENVTQADCEANREAVTETWIGKKVKLTEDGDELLVLDAQAFCVPATKQEHA